MQTYLIPSLFSLFLFCLLSLLKVSLGIGSENPFTPKASLMRYWNKEISSSYLPNSSFLLSKASPLNAIDAANFARLAAWNSLSTQLPAFCSSANLLCFPDLLPSLEKHDKDSNFAFYQNKNFTNYGNGRPGGLDSFKNYSDGEAFLLAISSDSFRRYSRNAAGHDDKFSIYGRDLAVGGERFNTYGSGATGGSGQFERYTEESNIPNARFESYADGANGRAHEFVTYSTDANVGDQTFISYGKNGNGVPNEFSTYAMSSNVITSNFTNYGEMANGANDTFKTYSDGNVPENNFKNYGAGGNAGTESFAAYRVDSNVGDDSFQSYAKNSNAQKINFAIYGEAGNGGPVVFGQYAQGASGQQIEFKTYLKTENTFKDYAKKGVKFATYTKPTPAAAKVKSSLVNKWVEPGKFFRESKLKEGTIMPMPDIRDKMPKRSFLPRTILSKLPFSISKVTELKQIFHVGDDSTMESIILNALNECERAPSTGETKRCVGSAEDMIDFATSVLGRNVAVRTTENVKGSKKDIMIGAVKGIDGGKITKSVSCHQSLYPYLLYYCHSVPKVRVYEAEILDRNSKEKVNNGVSICHLDTSSWSPTHGAFMALGYGPGRIEVCHWIFENDMTWTISDS